MPQLTRQEKISFGEMRASGVRGLLIYCSDYRCGHSTTISGDGWPDAIYIELINGAFLKAGGSPDEYRTGLDIAIAKGWLWRHEFGTYVKFTEAGAELFARWRPRVA